MGFGGAAAAANAAIKRNAALRKNKIFLGQKSTTWGPLPGRMQSASDAVRKRFRNQYHAERQREHRRDLTLTLGATAVLFGTVWYCLL